MEDLIKALLLIQQYMKDPNAEFPTGCEHDTLFVCGVNMKSVPVEAVHELAKLGFFPGDGDCDAHYVCFYNEDGEYDGEIDFETVSSDVWDGIKGELTSCFHSYRFGSC